MTITIRNTRGARVVLPDGEILRRGEVAEVSELEAASLCTVRGVERAKPPVKRNTAGQEPPTSDESEV